MRDWAGRILCALIVSSMGVAVQAITITDDRGVQVSLAQPPQRIVSLFPALTEAVCQLGQCHRLVGVDKDSNFPLQVGALPKVGGGLEPSLEAVMALQPDLVLVASSTRGASRLQALGMPVAAMQPRTHADIRRMLERLGVLLQVPPQTGALRVWEKIERELESAAQSVPAALRGLRVYVEVDQGPYAASESSFIGETLKRLGLVNVVPANLGDYPKINPEFVVRSDPDLIVISHPQAAAIAARPGWSRMRAVRKQAICALRPEQADLLMRAGPRLGEAAQLMVQCLSDKQAQGGLP